jgi:hypothetical protein
MSPLDDGKRPRTTSVSGSRSAVAKSPSGGDLLGLDRDVSKGFELSYEALAEVELEL